MKILLISSLFPPHSKGGAEKIAHLVAHTLVKHDTEVVIVTTEPYTGWRSLVPHVTDEDGMRVWRFFPLNLFWFGNIDRQPPWKRFLWHIMDTLNILSAVIIYTLLKHEKPDVVLTHNLKGIGYLIPLVARLCKTPLLHTVHDVQLYTPSGLILFGQEQAWEHQNVLTQCYRVLTRFAFAACSMIIFPSKFLQDFYHHHGFFLQQTTIVLPNPVEAPSSHTPIPVPELKNQSTMHFLFLGQLEPSKGILFLVQALLTFKTQHPKLPFIFHIAGQGSQESTLKTMIANTPEIIFEGYISAKRRELLLANTDLCIVPSLCYENIPTVILESLSQRVPVLASRIGGIPELIEDGVNGGLFTPGSASEFQEKLLNCLKNPSIIAGWRQNIDKTQLPTPTVYVKQLLQKIKEIKH